MNHQNFATMREAMVVSQLRTAGINEPRVMDAFKAVPREAFVPEGRASLAYVDTAIPLGDGRALNPPLATARLITEADVQAGDHVLLIGAATGYAAAILAYIGATVIAVEEQADLVAAAKAQLKGSKTVTLVNASLAAGAKKHAPYDVVVIDGAVAHIPDALIAQLNTGGRLVCGLIERGVTRIVAGRKSAGGFGLLPVVDMGCVSLPGFTQPKGFAF